jgi:putative sigma-54 modulation protein
VAGAREGDRDVNILVKSPHMAVTETIRQQVEGKVAKLPRFYDSVQTVEVTLNQEAEKSSVEIVVTAKRRATFVARHRDDDMYAALDQCLHKITEQLRRHKDKVRDRQGPPHGQRMT